LTSLDPNQIIIDLVLDDKGMIIIKIFVEKKEDAENIAELIEDKCKIQK